VVPASLQAVLSLVLSLILSLILGLTLSLILTLILALSLPAILSLTLRVATAPPVVDVGLAALAVIAVMAAAGVGARGHAHHQHRRKQQGRLQHGSRPRWSSPHYNARNGVGFAAALCPALGALYLHILGACPSPACGGGYKMRPSALRPPFDSG